MHPLVLQALICYGGQLLNASLSVAGILDNYSSLLEFALPVSLAVLWYSGPSFCLSTRALVIAGMICLWSVRLGVHIARRWWIRGRTDGRNDDRRGTVALALYWPSIIGTWGFVNTLPFYAVLLWGCNNGANESSSFTRDFLGLVLFAFGFALESWADHLKLASFAKSPQKQRFNLGSVFELSRNPQFAGEFLLWLGVSIFASSNLHGWHLASVYGAPALTLYAMLFGTAANIAEYNNNKRFGGQRELVQITALLTSVACFHILT